MQVETQLIKEALYEIKQTFMMAERNARVNRVRDSIADKVNMVERFILLFLDLEKKGDATMIKEKIKVTFGEESFKLAEITSRRVRNTELDDIIKVLAKAIPTGVAKPVNLQNIDPNYFSTKVYRMQELGEIDKEVYPMKVKGQLCLARVTKEEAAERRIAAKERGAKRKARREATV